MYATDKKHQIAGLSFILLERDETRSGPIKKDTSVIFQDPYSKGKRKNDEI